jgi:hypothetical protein
MVLLKAIYEAQDGIPEAYRELYTERNGKWELTEVEGVKTQTDVDKLTEAARKERADHADTKKTLASLKPFADLEMTHEELQEKLDRVEELEAAAKAGGKLNEEELEAAVERRLARKLKPLERQISTLTEERDALTGKVGELQGREDRRAVVKAAVAAAQKAGVPQDALPDVELAAEVMLVRETESGDIITKDGIGVTPNVGAETWIADMLPKRPMWNPTSSGGGARGSGKSGGFPDNPYTEEHWNVSAQGKLMQENPEKAKQMAAAAGVTVDAVRPKQKKA